MIELKPSRKMLSVLLMLIAISLLSSVTNASVKQWPMRSKGEVRYLKFIKVYDISLFSPSKISAKTILKPYISKCLKLDYAVNLSVDKLSLATTKILKQQHSAEYLATIKNALDRFQNAYQAVNKGDSYTLCYNGKNQLMQLELNDKKLIEVKSAEFAKTYLGIWLSSNKPISEPLYRTFFPR